jgi:hypothetical protein
MLTPYYILNLFMRMCQLCHELFVDDNHYIPSDVFNAIFKTRFWGALVKKRTRCFFLKAALSCYVQKKKVA